MYIIKDWAGNEVFKGKTFKTFQDAWGFLYNHFSYLSDSEFDDTMQEYEVVRG